MLGFFFFKSCLIQPRWQKHTYQKCWRLFSNKAVVRLCWTYSCCSGGSRCWRPLCFTFCIDAMIFLQQYFLKIREDWNFKFLPIDGVYFELGTFCCSEAGKAEAALEAGSAFWKKVWAVLHHGLHVLISGAGNKRLQYGNTSEHVDIVDPMCISCMKSILPVS